MASHMCLQTYKLLGPPTDFVSFVEASFGTAAAAPALILRCRKKGKEVSAVEPRAVPQAQAEHFVEELNRQFDLTESGFTRLSQHKGCRDVQSIPDPVWVAHLLHPHQQGQALSPDDRRVMWEKVRTEMWEIVREMSLEVRRAGDSSVCTTAGDESDDEAHRADSAADDIVQEEITRFTVCLRLCC